MNLKRGWVNFWRWYRCGHGYLSSINSLVILIMGVKIFSLPSVFYPLVGVGFIAGSTVIGFYNEMWKIPQEEAVKHYELNPPLIKLMKSAENLEGVLDAIAEGLNIHFTNIIEKMEKKEDKL